MRCTLRGGRRECCPMFGMSRPGRGSGAMLGHRMCPGRSEASGMSGGARNVRDTRCFYTFCHCHDLPACFGLVAEDAVPGSKFRAHGTGSGARLDLRACPGHPAASETSGCAHNTRDAQCYSTVCRCRVLPVLWLVVDDESAVPCLRYRTHGVARVPCSATGRALAVLKPQERPVAPAMLATLAAFTPSVIVMTRPLVWSGRRGCCPRFVISRPWHGLRCQAWPQDVPYPSCSLRSVRLRPQYSRHSMLFNRLSLSRFACPLGRLVRSLRMLSQVRNVAPMAWLRCQARPRGVFWLPCSLGKYSSARNACDAPCFSAFCHPRDLPGL